MGRYLWVNRAFLIHYAFRPPEPPRRGIANAGAGQTDYDLLARVPGRQFRMMHEHVLAGTRARS